MAFFKWKGKWFSVSVVAWQLILLLFMVLFSIYAAVKQVLGL